MKGGFKDKTFYQTRNKEVNEVSPRITSTTNFVILGIL